MRARLEPEQAGELVRRAREGDAGGWEGLVDGYVGLIWAITHGYRLSEGDAHDVTQTTWLRLVENIDRLADPQRVGAWLATTARRECLRVLRQSQRTVLLRDGEDLDGEEVDGEEVDASLLRLEQSDAVRQAIAQLPPAAQALLGLLMLDPAPSYEEVSAALGMPIGSIGPTRGRILRKLAVLVAERGITDSPRRVC